MEDRVIFAEYLENDPDDLDNMQGYIGDSIDHVVLDTIVPGRGYAGFAASKTGPAQVTVLSGRFYSGGAVYGLKVPTVYDFTSSLPVAAKKIVLISIWGTEVDTNVQERNFLIAATSTPQAPVYAPQAVAMTHSRVVNIGSQAGSESPDPQAPVLASTLLLVATVVLSPTGVVSVVNDTDNQVPNLQDVEDRVVSLEAWEAIAGPEITSISSDIQRLSNLIGSLNPNPDLVGRILLRLADLDAKEGIPSTSTDSSTDLFLTAGLSDTTNLLYSAKIMEGIRLPDAAANDTAIVIFNPLDANAMIRNAVLFPAFDRSLRTRIGPISGAVQVSAYTFQTITATLLQISRQRIRYGTPFIVCTNSAFWASGTYNAATGIFTRAGETFNLAYEGFVDNIHDVLNVPIYRATQFWVDTYTEPYWQYLSTDTTLSGTQIAETFPVGQDTWLESIGVTFTKLDSSGPVTLMVCHCLDTGQPDLTKVIGQVTVAFASLLLNVETNFPLQPTYLQAGKRYAVVLLTAANHFVASAGANAFPTGTYFALTAGGYAAVDLTKHLALSIYACKFRNPLVSIQFANLQLSGGMTGIDINAGAIVPASTKLTYEIQLAGVWVALNAANAPNLNAGGNLPPNVPLRATFAGTPDIMPCINLGDSTVHVSRPALLGTHISTELDPPSTTQIRIIERYEGFNVTYHTATVKLLTGTTFGTTVTPSSTTDAIGDSGALERTYVFNLGAAVTKYKIRTDYTTSTALAEFLVAWRKNYSL